VIGLLIGFCRVIIGLIAGKAIKEHLFDPWVVCFSRSLAALSCCGSIRSITIHTSMTPRNFRL